MTQREIAESVGLSQNTVHTIKVRLDITGTSSPQRSTSGRKLTVTPRVLIMECKKNRKMTSKQLQGTLEKHNVKTSTSCIRRHLISAGMIARRPRRKSVKNIRPNVS